MDFGGGKREINISNQIQLIQSRSTASEVVKRLWNAGYKNKMEIFGASKYYPKGERARRFLKKILSFGLFNPEELKNNYYDYDYNEKVGLRFANKILKKMRVRNIPSTDMLQISFTSPFNWEASTIVNTITDVVVDLDIVRNSKMAEDLVGFLNSQLEIQSKELFNAELKLKAFKEKELVFDLHGNAPMILEKLVEAESNYFNTIAEVNITDQNYEYIKSKLSEDESTLSEKLISDINSQLNTLRLSIVELESQLVKNKIQYGNNHEAVIENKNRINSLKEQLEKKTNQLILGGVSVANPLEYRQELITNLLNLSSLKSNLSHKVKEFKKLVDFFNEQLNGLPKKQLEFARLERDYSVLANTYNFIRQKLEEAKIDRASETAGILVVDYATTPNSPVSPIHSRNIATGIFLGLFLGIGLVGLIEFSDNTVRSTRDIESRNLTVLGIIPSLDPKDIDNSYNSLLSRFSPFKNKNVNSASISKKLKRKLITREDPKSPISEAYRSLRTSMIYSSVDKEVKSILVSSSGPGEGKTTTVANLAITYANLGKKTLLIDADLRRPVIDKVFNLNREPGITNYLVGSEKNFDSLVQKSTVDNLYIVTSGIIPPNPSELLGSNKMSKLVSKLENEWDMVLFDSPPLVAVTDATMISKEIDQIVMVVKAGHTDNKAFEHTVNNLQNIDAPLGGIILNAVTSKNSYGSYYYYYQYYHYYGSDK